MTDIKYWSIPPRVIEHWQREGRSNEEILQLSMDFVKDCLYRHKRFHHGYRQKPYFEYAGNEPERF